MRELDDEALGWFQRRLPWGKLWLAGTRQHQQPLCLAGSPRRCAATMACRRRTAALQPAGR